MEQFEIQPGQTNSQLTSAVQDPASTTADNYRAWLLRAILLALVFLTFWPALWHKFLPWDDVELIVNNPHIHQPYIQGLRHFWTQAYDGLYSPLFYTSYLLEVMAAKGDHDRLAQLVHFDNLLLHALNAILVLGFLRQIILEIGPPRLRIWAAFAGALFFAIHPLQAEAVNWATGRKDLLGWLFAFLSLSQYTTWRRTGAVQSYIIASILFLFALLSKPTTAALPAAAAVLDIYLFNIRAARVARGVAPWAAVSLIFAIISSRIQGSAGAVEAVPPLWSRLLIAADSYSFYFKQIVMPSGFSPVYAPVNVVLTNRVLLYTAFVLMLIPAGLVLWRRNVVTAGVAMAMVLLLPTSGLVAFHYQTISSVADRYAYGALLGLAVFVTVSILRLATITGRPLLVTSLCFLLLPPLAIISWRQSLVWRSSDSLWSHAVTIAPTSPVAHNNLGMTLGEKGDLKAAEAEFEEAVRLNPSFAGAHNNLANIHSAAGHQADAAKHYEQALQAEPTHVVARTNLMLLQFENNPAEADQNAIRILEKDPDNIRALNVRAVILGNQGHGQQALKLLRDAAARKPENSELAALLQQAEQIMASQK